MDSTVTKEEGLVMSTGSIPARRPQESSTSTFCFP